MIQHVMVVRYCVGRSLARCVLSLLHHGLEPGHKFWRMNALGLRVCWSSNSTCGNSRGKSRVLGADDIRCLPGIAVSPGSLVLPSGAVGCVSSVATSGARRGLCPRLQGPAPFGITSGEKQIGDGSRGSSKLDAFPSFFSRLDPPEG